MTGDQRKESNLRFLSKKNKISDPEKFEVFFKKLYGEETYEIDTFHRNIENIVQEKLKYENSEFKNESEIFDPEISMEELKKTDKEIKK